MLEVFLLQQCNVVNVYVVLSVWNYMPVEKQIFAFNTVFVRINYTSSMAACYVNDFIGVTAPHVYKPNKPKRRET